MKRTDAVVRGDRLCMASRCPAPLDRPVITRAEPLGRLRKNGMRIESEVSIYRVPNGRETNITSPRIMPVRERVIGRATSEIIARVAELFRVRSAECVGLSITDTRWM